MAKKTAKVFNLEGKQVGKITLPSVFETPLRPDIIKRAVIAAQSNRLQPQGRDAMAGKRTTAESRGTGSGQARIPRLKGASGMGAFAPGTVGGRQAHPPKSWKKIIKKIPRKERRLALYSAIAATASKEIVTSRGHSAEDVSAIPLIVTDDLEELKRVKAVEEALIHLGVLSDIYRVKESRKVRSGKGKQRGRRTKQAVGPLIVISENRGIREASRNIPGVNVVSVKNLNVESLAPGAHPGRLTVWTNSAVEKLAALQGEGEMA